MSVAVVGEKRTRDSELVMAWEYERKMSRSNSNNPPPPLSEAYVTQGPRYDAAPLRGPSPSYAPVLGGSTKKPSTRELAQRFKWIIHRTEFGKL